MSQCVCMKTGPLPQNAQPRTACQTACRRCRVPLMQDGRTGRWHNPNAPELEDDEVLEERAASDPRGAVP